MKPKLAIIGANEYQDKLVLKANSLGYETHVFAWEDGAVAKEHASIFYPVSITDSETILKTLSNQKVEGIISIGSDLAMPTVNFIAQRLGLNSNSLECTLLSTNKYEMRKALIKHQCPCPYFQWVSDLNSVKHDEFSYPIIIKPIDRSGSRGIFLAHNRNELKEGIEYALSVSFEKNVLIEEYIEGKEYSVEYISQNGKHSFIQVTEKFTTNAPHFIERGHLAPARISSLQEMNIRDVVEKALDALQIREGASHSEVKIQPNGDIKIIEIAGRMGGDFIGSDLVYHSTGYDYVANVIRVSTRQTIEQPQLSNKRISLVGFIFNDLDLQRYRELEKQFPNIVIESHINPHFSIVTDSSSRNGYFILSIENQRDLDRILSILGFES